MTSLPKIKGKVKHFGPGNSYYVYNTESVMAHRPHEFAAGGKMNGWGIRFFEHPVHGDEASVIAKLGDVMWATEFYDPWNDCDQGYIIQQAVEMGLLPADTILWNNTKRSEMAAELRARKSDLFTTFDSSLKLNEYLGQFNGSEKALAFIIAGITANTILECEARRIEEEGR